MRVVVAPDSFGGTLSATEAAAAIAEGWRRAAPHDELELLPVADGGTGFLAVLHAALGGTLHETTVSGPFGTAVEATWLQVGDTRLRRVGRRLRAAPRAARAARPGGRGGRHHPRGGGAGGGGGRGRCAGDRHRPGRLGHHGRGRGPARRARRPSPSMPPARTWPPGERRSRPSSGSTGSPT